MQYIYHSRWYIKRTSCSIEVAYDSAFYDIIVSSNCFVTEFSICLRLSYTKECFWPTSALPIRLLYEWTAYAFDISDFVDNRRNNVCIHEAVTWWFRLALFNARCVSPVQDFAGLMVMALMPPLPSRLSFMASAAHNGKDILGYDQWIVLVIFLHRTPGVVGIV